jgi:hypothetical protein
MDYMQSDWPFYLLQYLGFFPEVTNPVNIRTNLVADASLNGPILNHKFDADGKVISYDFISTGGVPSFIIWNCAENVKQPY